MSAICGNCFKKLPEKADRCSACGFQNTRNPEGSSGALPVGTVLYGRYIIGRILGYGRTDISYLGFDHKHQIKVVIREYFPFKIAVRTDKYQLAIRHKTDLALYDFGRQAFKEEVQTGSKLKDPGVIAIRKFFKENNTVYLVTAYPDGITFEKYIQNHGGKASWKRVKTVMLPILETLSRMHKAGVIHRGITAEHIYINRNHEMWVSNPDSANYRIAVKSHDLKRLLPRGIAPSELYQDERCQKPASDVYMAAATIYRAATGLTPQDSLRRMSKDCLIPPRKLNDEISERENAALVKALSPKPENRFDTMAAFLKAFNGQEEEKGQQSVLETIPVDELDDDATGKYTTFWTDQRPDWNRIGGYAQETVKPVSEETEDRRGVKEKKHGKRIGSQKGRSLKRKSRGRDAEKKDSTTESPSVTGASDERKKGIGWILPFIILAVLAGTAAVLFSFGIVPNPFESSEPDPDSFEGYNIMEDAIVVSKDLESGNTVSVLTTKHFELTLRDQNEFKWSVKTNDQQTMITILCDPAKDAGESGVLCHIAAYAEDDNSYEDLSDYDCYVQGTANGKKYVAIFPTKKAGEYDAEDEKQKTCYEGVYDWLKYLRVPGQDNAGQFFTLKK